MRFYDFTIKVSVSKFVLLLSAVIYPVQHLIFLNDIVVSFVIQERVTKLSPRPVVEEDLARLFEESMSVF